jgi:UDP-N-acetylglucosamine acyltransferase
MANGSAKPKEKPNGPKRPNWFSSLLALRFFSAERRIHEKAIVDPEANIAEDVEIGPFCVIGPHVTIESGCRLLNSVTVVGHTTLGRDNICFPHAVLGAVPQDKKYRAEPTTLEIGNGNVFREAVTVHVGTEKGGGITRVGDNNLLMVNCHLGHDVTLGNNCVLANNVMIAGHVLIGDYVNMMGGVGVHHFVTIGDYAYIGGYSRIHKDVPPFVKIDGADEIRGLNTVGLRRAGYAEDDIKELERAHRNLFGRKKPLSVAMSEYDLMNGVNPHVKRLIEFLHRRNEGKHGRYLESQRKVPAGAIVVPPPLQTPPVPEASEAEKACEAPSD